VRQRVVDRDHGCVICGAIEGLEVHHLAAVRDGGPTTPDNLIVLCRDHHLEVEAEQRG
jgi:5-methylcytosine-specific restriction endonuclease McrA